LRLENPTSVNVSSVAPERVQPTPRPSVRLQIPTSTNVAPGTPGTPGTLGDDEFYTPRGETPRTLGDDEFYTPRGKEIGGKKIKRTSKKLRKRRSKRTTKKIRNRLTKR
jgi:hypothetical protein